MKRKLACACYILDTVLSSIFTIQCKSLNKSTLNSIEDLKHNYTLLLVFKR